MIQISRFSLNVTSFFFFLKLYTKSYTLPPAWKYENPSTFRKFALSPIAFMKDVSTWFP